MSDKRNRLILWCSLVLTFCAIAFTTASRVEAQTTGQPDPRCVLHCAVKLGIDLAAAEAALVEGTKAFDKCNSEADRNLQNAIASCNAQWASNPQQRQVCISQANSTNASAKQGCDSGYSAAKDQYNKDVQAAADEYDACVARCKRLQPIPIKPHGVGSEPVPGTAGVAISEQRLELIQAIAQELF